MRRPFSPAASTSRPAESPGGLVNTEPAFGPPGWLLPPPAHDLGDQRLGRGRGRPGAARARPDDHLGGAERRVAVAEGELAAGHATRPRRVPRSTTADPTQHGGDVRAVAAGVHAHRAADRARHPDRPLEAVRPAAADRRATTGRLAAPPAHAPRSPSIVDRVEAVAQHARPRRRSRRRPPAGSSPARAPAPATPRRRARRRSTAARSSSSAGVDEQRGRARPRGRWSARPSGTSRAARAPSSRGRRRRRRPPAIGRVTGAPLTAAVERGHDLVGQRREVAGAEGQAQVAGTQHRAHVGDAARRGAGT